MRRNAGIEYYDVELESQVLSIEEQFYLRDLKQRKLFLNCEVCQASVSDLVRHIFQINAEDKDLPIGKRRPIILYISSPGGDVDAGFGLIDAIQASQTPVYTVNTGFCYSMAFLICLAGDKRFSSKNARFLMHDGSMMSFNSTSKLKDQMEFQNKADERIKEYVVYNSNVTDEEYDEKYRMEWYMFADEAKERGFIDCIIGEDCPLDEVV